MNPNKPTNNQPDDDPAFKDWLEEKRRTPAPDGFSDRVLERLQPDQPQQKPFWGSVALWAKAAVFALALAGGLGRYALLFLFLLTN